MFNQKNAASFLFTLSVLLALLTGSPLGRGAEAKPDAQNDTKPAPQSDMKCLKPGMITSVGQSSDVAVVKALLNARLKLGLEVKVMAEPSDLAQIKTLVVVLGASTKGMGAAGLNMDKELERAKTLVSAAKEKGVRILALHVGGESRRGKTTDDLLRVVLPESAHIVVVASGNQDKLFNTIAAPYKVPVTEVPNLAGAGEAVKALFQE